MRKGILVVGLVILGWSTSAAALPAKNPFSVDPIDGIAASRISGIMDDTNLRVRADDWFGVSVLADLNSTPSLKTEARPVASELRVVRRGLLVDAPGWALGFGGY